jgi:hypothetical protein
MRYYEIIQESITFSPSGGDFYERKQVTCIGCDGAGTEKYSDKEYVCPECNGTGLMMDTVPVGDWTELNVSNANAFAIFNMLGIEGDYAGTIRNRDLPKLMQKLIALKNKDSSRYTRDPETSQGPMRRYKDDDGQDRIGRGATWHDMGRSQSQVDRYIDSLIKLVKFAQQNDADLGWG